MRSVFHFLPIVLIPLSLPSIAAQAEASNTQIIQIIRSGKGLPRVRDASAARVAAPRTVDPAGRTVPYQVPKPGEGAPKN
jgi:hypothetical protein